MWTLSSRDPRATSRPSSMLDVARAKPEGAPDMKNERRPSLGAIFLTVTLDLLGFGLVMPFLAEEARTTFHSTAFVGTLLSAVYSLMQFVFVPVWGRLSDRIGR